MWGVQIREYSPNLSTSELMDKISEVEAYRRMPKKCEKEVKAVKDEDMEEDNNKEEESEEEDSVCTEWEGMEDDIADLVDSLKRKLAQINAGIRDTITLAQFVCFVEVNSTSL